MWLPDESSLLPASLLHEALPELASCRRRLLQGKAHYSREVAVEEKPHYFSTLVVTLLCYSIQNIKLAFRLLQLDRFVVTVLSQGKCVGKLIRQHRVTSHLSLSLSLSLSRLFLTSNTRVCLPRVFQVYRARHGASSNRYRLTVTLKPYPV